jgi:hypothetical protein
MPFPVFEFPPIGLLIELASKLGGAFVVMTAASAGFLGALAVLTDRTASRTERWTAAGFVIGAAFTICFVVIDVINGLG